MQYVPEIYCHVLHIGNVLSVFSVFFIPLTISGQVNLVSDFSILLMIVW